MKDVSEAIAEFVKISVDYEIWHRDAEDGEIRDLENVDFQRRLGAARAGIDAAIRQAIARHVRDIGGPSET